MTLWFNACVRHMKIQQQKFKCPKIPDSEPKLKIVRKNQESK